MWLDNIKDWTQRSVDDLDSTQDRTQCQRVVERMFAYVNDHLGQGMNDNDFIVEIAM